MTKSQQLEILRTNMTYVLENLTKRHTSAIALVKDTTPVGGLNFTAGYSYLEAAVGYVIADLRRALEDSQ